MALPRPCKKCKKRFQPTSGCNTHCPKCLKNVRHENFIKLIAHRNNIKLKC